MPLELLGSIIFSKIKEIGLVILPGKWHLLFVQLWTVDIINSLKEYKILVFFPKIEEIGLVVFPGKWLLLFCSALDCRHHSQFERVKNIYFSLFYFWSTKSPGMQEYQQTLTFPALG